MAGGLCAEDVHGERSTRAVPGSLSGMGYRQDYVIADRAGTLSAGSSAKALDEVFNLVGTTAEDAKKTAEAMLSAASRSGDPRLKVFGLCKAADALILHHDPTQADADQAIANCKEAKTLCDDLDEFEEGEAAVSYALARAYMRFGGKNADIQDKALDHGSDAAELCRSLGCKKGQAASLVTVGDAYHATQEQEKAAEYHKLALAVFKEIGEQKAVGFVYTKLAEDYLKIKPDLKKASNHAKRALVVFQELQDLQEEANCWHLLAQVQGAAHDIQEATQSVTNVRTLCKSLKDHVAEVKAMQSLVTTYLDNDLYQEGVKVAQEMVSICHDHGDRQREADSLVFLGQQMLRNYDYLGAEKVGSVAENLYKSLRDQDGAGKAKKVKEAAEHGMKSERIEHALARHQAFLHLPKTLIIDPGRQKRMQDSFNAFAKSV
eukprot:TRINITY_DN112775_c0_g1_i1.p1 TRINITY_DN112775_c0_g1~~TRINITY_DN112775_c0_g1_i1.p1  ORF type:complete len:434 (+),score=122.73 TRINITY_DN112775_c0_g1_i1:85-1386(+)